jgi:hypothetical protein
VVLFSAREAIDDALFTARPSCHGCSGGFPPPSPLSPTGGEVDVPVLSPPSYSRPPLYRRPSPSAPTGCSIASRVVACAPYQFGLCRTLGSMLGVASEFPYGLVPFPFLVLDVGIFHLN